MIPRAAPFPTLYSLPTTLPSHQAIPKGVVHGYNTFCRPSGATCVAMYSTLRWFKPSVGQAAARHVKSHCVGSEQTNSPLQSFLGWCNANGVEGIGTDGSKSGVYEQDNGERGLICVKDISEGEAIVRVPLRLAIIDHPSRGNSDESPYQGAPWSVRLATKLLKMLQEGPSSPWYPYLQVLPSSVPSPHATLSWEDIQSIQYQPMLGDFHHTCWVFSSAGSQLQAQSEESLTREQLEWALAVIHSRSFGSPGEGGVPVRMLVPLVDLLNHAGDEWVESGGHMPQVIAKDNVRWDMKPPSASEGRNASEGGWHMVVTATRDIKQGEELLLSYGERSNDSFFQHYGFVPPRNPHDDAILFENIKQGVHWLAEALAGRVPSAPSPAALDDSPSPNTAAALQAAAQHLPNLGQQPTATSQEEQDLFEREVSRIKLRKGARLDGRLLAAFDALAAAGAGAGLAGAVSDGELQEGEGWGKVQLQQRFHQLIALRCKQLLNTMPSTLLEDLEVLAKWTDPEAEDHGFDELLAQYHMDIAEYCLQVGSTVEQPFGGTHSDSDHSAQSAPSVLSGVQGFVDAGATGIGGEQEELLGLISALQSTPSWPEEEDTGGGQGEPRDAVARHVRTGMLPLVYRAYKKMILWDAILAAGPGS